MNTKTDELRALQDSVIQAAFDRWRKTEYPYAHPIQDLPAFHAGYLAALARQEEGREAAPRAWVWDMKTSVGMDYYVCVGWPDRYLTPQMHKIRGRAEYDVAEWNHMLGHGPEPDILAFDTDHPTPPIAALAPPSGGEGDAVHWLDKALADPALSGPAAQFRAEEEVIQTRVLHALAKHNRRLATPAPHSGGEGDAYAAGVKACIAWVEKRRHDFEAEYGTVDPTTNAMEFRNAALEEYDCELAEIEEGLRTLIATPTPQAGGATQAHALAELREAMDIADPTERDDALVSFFRTAGSAMGRHGDAMGWTPEQTARYFLWETFK